MQAQDSLSFTELILNASLLVQCVMLFLLALSIFSWAIIFSRSNMYRVGKSKADDFEEKFWSGIDLNNLYQECMKRPEDLVGLEVIYSAGFKEFVRLVNSGPADQEVVMDGTYRQMKVACSREIELLESHLPTLATIGSISPYIGLFGTVWGIMHAFVSLAAVKNASLAMVAPPIAEALIATAMGLFAAIPAVMFYNRFTSKVEALENRYYNFMDEFSTILNRRLVTIRSQFNRQQNTQNTVPVTQAPQAAVNAQAQSSSSMTNQISSSISENAEQDHAPSYENESRIVQEYDGQVSTSLNSAQGAAIESANDLSKRHIPNSMSGNISPSMMMGTSANLNSLQAQSMSQALHNAANNASMSGVLMKGSMDSAHLNTTHNTQGSSDANRMSTPYKVRQNQQPMSQGSSYNMAYRGVVPPQGNMSSLGQVQLPGGPASAVKPQLKDEQPLYKAGVDFDRRRQNVSNDEPHYIAPNSRRSSLPPNSNSNNAV